MVKIFLSTYLRAINISFIFQGHTEASIENQVEEAASHAAEQISPVADRDFQYYDKQTCSRAVSTCDTPRSRSVG